MYKFDWQWSLELEDVLSTGRATWLGSNLALKATPSSWLTQSNMVQVWLQGFAWTSKDLNKKQADLIEKFPAASLKLQQSPMFCMDTALKLLLWSDVAYECLPRAESELSQNHEVATSMRSTTSSGRDAEESLSTFQQVRCLLVHRIVQTFCCPLWCTICRHPAARPSAKTFEIASRTACYTCLLCTSVTLIGLATLAAFSWFWTM